jgi:hypothetical protein
MDFQTFRRHVAMQSAVEFVESYSRLSANCLNWRLATKLVRSSYSLECELNLADDGGDDVDLRKHTMASQTLPRRQMPEKCPTVETMTNLAIDSCSFCPYQLLINHLN